MTPEQKAHGISVTSANTVKREYSRQFKKAMTEEECILWSCIRDNKLAALAFRRQTVLRGFIVDFYCCGSRLIVEIDGPIHDKQREYDRERDAIFASHGIRTLRFTNQEIRQNLRGVLQSIVIAGNRQLGLTILE